MIRSKKNIARFIFSNFFYWGCACKLSEVHDQRPPSFSEKAWITKLPNVSIYLVAKEISQTGRVTASLPLFLPVFKCLSCSSGSAVTHASSSRWRISWTSFSSDSLSSCMKSSHCRFCIQNYTRMITRLISPACRSTAAFVFQAMLLRHEISSVK